MQYTCKVESRAAGSGPLSAIESRLVTSSLHFMSYLLPKKGLPGQKLIGLERRPCCTGSRT